MLRINIEGSIWSDHRFQSFMLDIGDRHIASGMVVNLWILAQQFWIPEKKLIPQQEWNASNLSDLLVQHGLAELKEEGIYAKGIEKHFGWWFERQEAGRKGGLRSAELRRSKVKQDSSIAQVDSSKIKQIQPSSSSSVSNSKRRRVVDPSDTTLLWNHYSTMASTKGVQVVHEGAKTNSHCSSLVINFGLAIAQELVDAYFRDDSQYVKDKSWPLALLVSQQQNYLNKTRTQSSNQSSEQKQPLDFGNEWG